MTKNTAINSDDYWNDRFEGSWCNSDGPRQSRFFSKIAIGHLPAWIISHMKQHSLTLADWGCAQGDGTDVWASYIDPQHIIGIDFSSVAIKLASKRYPAIKFINEDWLSEEYTQLESVDVLFSSNTLEHFHNPYKVLKTIANRAKKAIVLAVPYREFEERIEEHFYSFLPENIPLQLDNGFRLIHSRIVNCKNLPETFWNGEQAILVYAEPNWISTLHLTLNDCWIVQDDLEKQAVNKLNKRHTRINMLNLKIDELSLLKNKNNELINTLNLKTDELSLLKNKNNEFINTLNSKIDELSFLNNNINKDKENLTFELSQSRNKAMEVSNWANQIDSNPIKHAFKKYAFNMGRYCFRKLPLNLNLKHKLRENLRRITSHGKTTDKIIEASNQPLTLVNLDQYKPRDILFFSVIDWHFRIQRPQQLARGFAKAGNRVFYLSNHFIDSEVPGYQIEQLDATLSIYQIKLHVKGAPAIYFAPPTLQAQVMLEASFVQFSLDYSVISSVAIIEHAYWYDLMKCLPNAYHIYDCMDHHEGFGNVPEKLITIEKKMLQHSDIVVVTSTWLEKFAREFTTKVAVVRNACEFDHFSQRPSAIFTDTPGRKIIGYYGAIAEWFDLELVANIANANPDVLVLLIGNDTINAQSFLKNHKNIVFTGEVPYVDLPFYLYAFDICILPFLVTPLTLATNPVKIYEYLAAGKPVVSIDLPEISQFNDTVHSAKTAEEFVNIVAQELKAQSDSDQAQIDDRKKFAFQQTWDQRVIELNGVLQNMQMPKISVVVLTYNNLELTKACLTSLVNVSDYPNLEIIVVDNASTDGTPAYLREFKLSHQNSKIILNEHNVGFSAGNNIGLASATGDYLVLLNNDTVVTQGWALSLMRHLQTDETIGLIGPVTNNIGNEARIKMKYSNIADMPAEALHYTLRNMGKKFLIKNVAFFCVMMPRSTYKKCGLLCEEYGLGFFEDDDYCRQVEASGLKIMCAKDVFIHHHLSASFNKLPNKSKQDLMEKNKAIYESKWGPWEPHVHQAGHH